MQQTGMTEHHVESKLTDAQTQRLQPSASHKASTNLVSQPQHPAFDQKEEAAKAIKFMVIKAALFILVPVLASAIAVFFLL